MSPVDLHRVEACLLGAHPGINVLLDDLLDLSLGEGSGHRPAHFAGYSGGGDRLLPPQCAASGMVQLRAILAP